MKKSVFAIAAIALFLPALNVNAQEDKYGPNSAECLKYLSYYEEYYKQKNYDDATPNWRQAYKYCPPQSRQKMLVDGTALMRKLISKNAKNPIYRQALIDSLMFLHDQRAQFFPNNAVTAMNNKGLDMANYIKDNDQYLYDNYNAIIEANAEKTKPSIFLFDLKAAIELYKTGVLAEEDIIETYNRNSDLLASAVPANEIEAEQIARIKEDHESLFVASKVASCDKLISLFTPRFNENPNDADLAQKIVSFMLKTEDCVDNELISRAAATLYTTNQNASTAYLCYQLYSQRGKIEEATKYLEATIACCESAEVGTYAYELATYCFKAGNNIKAVEAAQKAIANDASNSVSGKAYMLIATIWSAQKCSGNEIESRAKFWVAVDYYRKAKAADESLAEECNRKIAECSAYFPATADAFMYDIKDGESKEVSCGGLRAVTTVRTQK